MNEEKPVAPSELLFDELYGKTSRPDRKASLSNVKKACDYLFLHSRIESITYDAIAEYIRTFGGKPSSGQVIKNDKYGLKNYIDLRKKEMRPNASQLKYGAPNDKYSGLLELDKDSLVTQLILERQKNSLFERKIKQLISIANRTVHVDFSSSHDAKSLDNNIKMYESRTLSRNEQMDLIENLFQQLADNYGFEFRRDGIFKADKLICNQSQIATLAKAIGMSVETLVAYLE